MTSPSGSGYVIENCQTLERYNVVFDTTASVADGTVFNTNYPNQNTCYSVISQLNDFEDWDLVNLPIGFTYNDCLTCLGSAAAFTASFLVVAGGGGSGTDNGGGGGAGGLLSGSLVITPFNTYNAIVGAGGTYSGEIGSNGSDSKIIINSTDFSVSVGGGGGASNASSGSNGGSGGGAGGFFIISGAPGPQFLPVSGGIGVLGQGFNGGNNPGSSDLQKTHLAGGGGGSSQEGSMATKFVSAKGGNGSKWLDNYFYAGGGGGVGSFSEPIRRIGGINGIGGGGVGNIHEYARSSLTQRGIKNTGGGAGGAGQIINSPSVIGGSGIVKLAYPGQDIKIEGGYVYKKNGLIYHTFTSTQGLDISLRFNYPNGYIVKECQTQQTLTLAWPNSSSIELGKTLFFDTREIQGCYLISQSVSVANNEYDYINLPYVLYNDCNDCQTDATSSLQSNVWYITTAGTGSGANFTNVQWYNMEGNFNTASFSNQLYPQVNNMFILSPQKPEVYGATNNLIVSPILPNSGSAFTIEVIAGGGATSEGSNYNNLFTGSYAFSYKDENGITQNTTIASGSTQQFCVTEVSQSFNLVRQLPLFPAPITVYYNPFQITKIQDNCL